jgi:hypothetical protein
MKKKRRWIIAILLSVLALSVAGFLFAMQDEGEGGERLKAALPPQTRQVLDNGPQFILYSLDPQSRGMKPADLKGKPIFHQYIILGQTPLKNAQTRADVLSALYKGIRTNKGGAAKCFNPRHGIRAVQGNQTVDLVICFECRQIKIYDGNGQHNASTESSPQPVFDRVLSQARVPLAGR